MAEQREWGDEMIPEVEYPTEELQEIKPTTEEKPTDISIVNGAHATLLEEDGIKRKNKRGDTLN